MKGILIKDKEAETVVTAVYRHWIIGINSLGYGVPTQHIFSDNGTEFTSDISEEFSKLVGIDWRYTPSHSPHSNGSCAVRETFGRWTESLNNLSKIPRAR